MLDSWAARTRAAGIDQSPQMLSVARARIERAGLRNVQLRQGDIYAAPVEPMAMISSSCIRSCIISTIPACRSRGARALRPVRLLIVDFAPHEEEMLRSAHAHRRLGFAAAEIAASCRRRPYLIARTISRRRGEAISSPCRSGSAATTG